MVSTTEIYSAIAPDLAALQNEIGPGLPTGIIDFGVGTAFAQAGKSSRVYAVDNGGHILTGWPIPVTGVAPDSLPLVNSLPPSMLNIAGSERVVAGIISGDTALYDSAGNKVQGLSPTQGSAAQNTPGGAVPPQSADPSAILNFIEYPGIGDLTGAGHPGIFQGGITVGLLANFITAGVNNPYKHVVQGWDPTTGSMYPTFPVSMGDYQIQTMPATAPVGDPSGNASLLAGTSMYELHALNLAGVDAPGFPKFTGGWAGTSPAAADLSGRGQVTVFEGTKEGRLFAWDTTGNACKNNEWWSFHHDEWSTGAYGTETRPPGALADFRIRQVTHDPGTGGFTAEWTSSGDHFFCGTAPSASLRVSGQPITLQNFFKNATEVGQPTPGAPGVDPTVTISNAAVGQCLYVGLQVTSNAGLKSPVAEALDGPDSCPPIPNAPGITNAAAILAANVPEAPADWLFVLAAVVGLGVVRGRRRLLAVIAR